MKVLNIFICVFAINFISPNTIYLISAAGSIRSKPCYVVTFGVHLAILPQPSYFRSFVVIVDQNVRTLDVSVNHRFGLSVQKMDSLRDPRQDPHPLFRLQGSDVRGGQHELIRDERVP